MIGKTLHTISKSVLIATTFAFGIITFAKPILLDNADAINTTFNFKTQEIVEDPNDANSDKIYYKSAFKSVKEVKANGEVYNESIVAEGVTLLKNDNNALPLSNKDDAKGVSLFSTSSVEPITAGTGSSGSSASSITLKEGLETAGLKVNGALYSWYEDNFAKYGRTVSTQGVGALCSIGDASWSEISTNSKVDAEYGQAAIMVISRSGGEGADSPIGIPAGEHPDLDNDYYQGNYLKLNENERSVLTELKKQKDAGIYSKIVVLLNSANNVECDFISDPAYGVDAALWCGLWGQTGAYAIGDILVGNVNPSGKLSDTIYNKHYLNPVHANFGTFTSSDYKRDQWCQTSSASNARDIVYQENIYSGYRYSETRYYDKIANPTGSNAGDFNYYDLVAYPFGYGLSYTNFEYSNLDVDISKLNEKDLNDRVITVTVDVKNTGNVAGKEAVQLYLSKPYTQYDIDNGIEKSAVELVDFGKTAILDPQESETVTMSFKERELASYDALKAKTFIIDQGDYYFTIGKSAHDATNNILASLGYTTDDGKTEGQVEDLVYTYRQKEFDDKTYSKSIITGKEVTNQFDNVDFRTYDGAGENKERLVYVTRSNWQDTVKFGMDSNNNRTNAQYNVIATDKMDADLKLSWNPKGVPEGGEYPTFGSTKTNWQLINLRALEDEDDDPTNNERIPYDNEMWDQLLDQLTWDEMVDFLSGALRKTRAIPSIGKPETIDHNGATGPVMSYSISKDINNGFAVKTDDPDKGQKPTVYPCNGLAAATMNKVLVDYYGRQWGEDCLWSGLAGLYGMGVNTHRSPYGGRNFEYYSEDPVLGGRIAAIMTKGMATRGTYVYLKHAFLNDQETVRCGGLTWATEQACREIYLKQFQIAIEEGGAQSVMTGLNSLGAMWCGGQGFVNTVLRDEFGMTGHAVTDSYGCYNGSFVRSVYYGNDLPDGTVNENNESFDFAKPDANGNGKYGDFAMQMREATHRTLYNVVHSNAMNGFGSGTKVYKVIPPWIPALDTTAIVIQVLFALSLVFIGATFYLTWREKHENSKND